jgi:hypothetical protein
MPINTLSHDSQADGITSIGISLAPKAIAPSPVTAIPLSD